MAKILIFSGSIRKDSLNKKLAKNAVDAAKEIGANVTYIDLKDFPMPIYNGDMEEESGLPDNAKKLKKLFIEHDGFFIASPEYNSSISPLLKNSLDWISRKHEENEPPLVAFTGKVFALGAASSGSFGGMRGLVHLRMMLGNIGAFVTPSQIAITFANEAFNNDDLLKEEKYKNLLVKVMKQLCEVTDKMNR